MGPPPGVEPGSVWVVAEVEVLAIASSGVVDDTVGWFLLSVVSALAAVGVRADQIGVSVAVLIGFVLVAFLVVRPLVRKLFARMERSEDASPTIGLTVVLILLAAGASHSLGMEPIFGAFVAGIVIGGGQAARLAPLRTVVLTVLAPIFMASAGLRMDLTALADPGVLVFGIVVLSIAIFGKFAGAYLGARWSRLSHWEALALGAGMNARGVVEVVVAMVGLRLGVLNTATFTIIVLVAVVTSLMAPPLLRLFMAKVESVPDEMARKAVQDEWLMPTSRAYSGPPPMVRPLGQD